MKESVWYVFFYIVTMHLAGLGLGMYLQEKITKYSTLRKCVSKDKPCPLLSKADIK